MCRSPLRGFAVVFVGLVVAVAACSQGVGGLCHQNSDCSSNICSQTGIDQQGRCLSPVTSGNQPDSGAGGTGGAGASGADAASDASGVTGDAASDRTSDAAQADAARADAAKVDAPSAADGARDVGQPDARAVADAQTDRATSDGARDQRPDL